MNVRTLCKTGLAMIALSVMMVTQAAAGEIKFYGDFATYFSVKNQAELTYHTYDKYTYVNVSNAAIKQTEWPYEVDTEKKDHDSDVLGELKFRLNVEASEKDYGIRAVVSTEVGAATFGDPNYAPIGGDKRGRFELRWAFLEYQLPFDSATTVTMGLQEVYVNDWLWWDNAAGVHLKRTSGDWSYTLGWFRNDVSNWGYGGDAEVNKQVNDDVYTVGLAYDFGQGNNLESFFVYREDGQESIDGATDAMDKLYWVGLKGTGAWGDYSGLFHAIYMGGEIVAGSGSAFSSGEESLDREAYLVNVSGSYTFGRNTATIAYLYSSGDDDPTDDKVENFDSIDTWSDFGSVVMFDGISDASFTNAPYIKDRGLSVLYAHYDRVLTEKTSATLGYLWINTATDMIENREVGHEFNVSLTHKMTSSFYTYLRAGYMTAGDGWDDLAASGDADDMYRADCGFRYWF